MGLLPEDPETLFQNLARDPVEITELTGADGSQATDEEALALLVSPERTHGWDTAGVDVTETLRRRDGGFEGNFLLFDGTDANSAQASFFGGQDANSFVRPGWVLVATYSQASSGGDSQVDITSSSRAIKIVARSRSTKVGSARCYAGGDIRIYRDTAAPVTQDDVAMLLGLGAFTRATRGLELCAYFEPSGDRLIYRIVTRDGRRVMAAMGDAIRARLAPIADNPFPTAR